MSKDFIDIEIEIDSRIPATNTEIISVCINEIEHNRCRPTHTGKEAVILTGTGIIKILNVTQNKQS